MMTEGENSNPEVSAELQHPPRNLLTNYDATVAALAEIEGEFWRKQQEKGGTYTTREALETLQSYREAYKDCDTNVRGCAVFWGDGGGTRYRVLTNGDVVFMPFYDIPLAHKKGKTKKEMALERGFKSEHDEKSS